MNIRDVVQTQLTQSTSAGKVVSGNAQFALMMSLFSQPGPAIMDEPDTRSLHEPHAITRPIQFSAGITDNPSANIALLKALNEEPLAQGMPYQYNAVEALESQINTRI